MPVYKTSKRTRYHSKTNWSMEHKGCLVTLTNYVNTLSQGGSNIVPSVSTQGTRTVGHFTITVPNRVSNREIWWALVFCPQGETVKNLFATTQSTEGSMYEPNQYVIASGISEGGQGPIRIRTSMKRKLHSGDFISLVLGFADSELVGTTLNALVSYAIKYN